MSSDDLFRTVRATRRELTSTPEDSDEAPTVSPFSFVWNEPFKSLWEIGFIQNIAEETDLRTRTQKTHKSGVILEERA
jgi:hypothetical protein